MQRKFDDFKKIQEVLQQAQTGLWAIELEDGKEPRMYADQTMLELLGLTGTPSPEECFQTWYNNIYEDYYPAVDACIDKMKLENRAEVEYPWRHTVLGKIFVRCGGVRDCSYPYGICLRGYHQNITDTIRLRQEKQVLEELNYEILDTLQGLFFAVYRIDLSKGTIKELHLPKNELPSAQEEIEYSCFIQQKVKNLYHPDDFLRLEKEFSLEALEKLCYQKHQKFAGEYRRIFGTQYRWVSLTISFWEGDGKGKWGILALQDIHLQKQREETNQLALEDACQAAKKANSAKSDFLSKMSHDIRTPLNAILGMTTIAEANLNDPLKVQDCIEKIKISGKLLRNLVNEILDMSRIESGNYHLNLSEFTMRELIDSVLSMVEPMFQEKQQIFKLNDRRLQEEVLVGDIMRIQQIFMNILTNANKYTPTGGTICFSIEEQLNQGNIYRGFQFTIEDTGIGMSQEFLYEIFEPFTRAEDSRISKVTGTGLGMAITYSIIQLMGGTIEVESELGRGSKFIVCLNFKKKEVQKKDELKIDKQKELIDISTLNLEGVHLLLAEDNELNMEIAKEFLELSGAKVKAVSNGKEALEEFRESTIGHYSIIFLDIQMPVMDGYQAARTIRALPRSDAADIPIMAMTANTFSEDIIMAKQAGMNEHIAKPLTLSKLSEILQKYLVHNT